MPLGKRFPDGEMHMECAKDTTPNDSGAKLHAIEVIFGNDDPNEEFTTHAITDIESDRRLSRGDRTAIILENLTIQRDRELTALICDVADNGKGSIRNRILDTLWNDPNLEWQKMYAHS